MQTPSAACPEPSGSVSAEPTARFRPVRGMSAEGASSARRQRWVLPAPQLAGPRGTSEVRSVSGPAGGVLSRPSLTPQRQGFGLEPLVESLTRDKQLLQKLHLEGQMENAQLRKQVHDLAEAFREHLNGAQRAPALPATPPADLRGRHISPQRTPAREQAAGTHDPPQSPLGDLAVNHTARGRPAGKKPAAAAAHECAKCPALLKEIQANRKEANKLRNENLKTTTAAEAWQLKAQLVQSDLDALQDDADVAATAHAERVAELQASVVEATRAKEEMATKNELLRREIDGLAAAADRAADLRQANDALQAQVIRQQEDLAKERALLVTELEMFRRKVASLDTLRQSEAAAKEAAEARAVANQKSLEAALRDVEALRRDAQRAAEESTAQPSRVTIDTLHAQIQQLTASLASLEAENRKISDDLARRNAAGKGSPRGDDGKATPEEGTDLRARLEDLIEANMELVRLQQVQAASSARSTPAPTAAASQGPTTPHETHATPAPAPAPAGACESDMADRLLSVGRERSTETMGHLDADAARLRQHLADLERERAELCGTLQGLRLAPESPAAGSPAAPRRRSMFGIELGPHAPAPSSRGSSPAAAHPQGVLPVLSVSRVSTSSRTPTPPPDGSLVGQLPRGSGGAPPARDPARVTRAIDVKQRLVSVSAEVLCVRQNMRGVDDARRRLNNVGAAASVATPVTPGLVPRDDADSSWTSIPAADTAAPSPHHALLRRALQDAEDDLSATAEELQATLAALRGEVHRAAAAEDNRHVLAADLQAARQQLRTAQAEHAAALKASRAARDDAAARAKDITALKQQLQTAEADVATAAAAARAAQEQLAALLKQKDDTAQSLESLQALYARETEVLKKENSGLAEKHGEALRQREALEAQHVDLRAQMEETHTATAAAFERRLADVVRERDDATRQHGDALRARDEEVRALRGQLEDTQQHVAHVAQHSKDAAARLEALRGEREAAGTALRDAQQRCEVLTAERDAMRQQRDSVGGEVKVFQAQLAALSTQLAEMEQSRAAFARETHEAKAEAQRQEIERTKVDVELKTARERFEEKAAAVEALQGKNKALKEKIRQHEAVSGELDKLRDRLRGEREQREAAQREADEEHERGAASARQVDMQSQQMETMRMEIGVLEKQLETTTSSLRVYEREALAAREALESANTTFENMAEQYEQDQVRMSKQLAQLRRAAEDECTAKEALQEELDATVASLESQSTADAELINEMQDALEQEKGARLVERTAHESRVRDLASQHERERADMEDEIRTTVSVADSFRKELDTERHAREETEQELSARLAQLVETHAQERNAVEAELAAAAKRCDDLGATVTSLEADVDEERAERRREKDEAREAAAALHQRLMEVQAQHDEARAEYERKIAALEASTVELRADVESKATALAAGREEAAEMGRRLARAEGRADELEDDMGRTITLLETTLHVNDGAVPAHAGVSLADRSDFLLESVQRLRQREEGAAAQVAALQAALQAEREEVSALKCARDTALSELDTERERVCASEASQEDLEHTYAADKAALAAEVAQLEAANASVSSQLADTLKECGALGATRDSLSDAQAALERQLAAAREESGTLERSCSDLEAQRAAAEEGRAACLRDLQDMQLRAAAAETDSAALQAQMQQAAEARAALEAMAQTAQDDHVQRVTELERDLGEARKTISELQAHIAQRTADVRALEEAAEQERASVQSQLDATASEMQAVFEEKDSLATQQLTQLEATVRELESGLAVSSEEYQALWKDCEQLRADVAAAETVSEGLRGDLAKVRARGAKRQSAAVQVLTEKLAESEGLRVELEAQHTALLHEFGAEREAVTDAWRLRRELDVLRGEEAAVAEELLQDVHTLRQEVAALTEAAAVHEAAAAKATREAAAATEALEMQHMESLGEKEALRAKVKAQTDEITMLMDEVTAFKTLGHAETADLKQQIRALNAELAEASGKVNAQTALLRAKDHDMQHATAELKAQNEQLRLAHATMEGRCETLTRRLGATEEEVRTLVSLRVPPQLAAETSGPEGGAKETREAATATDRDLEAHLEWEVQRAELKRQLDRQKELQNDMRTEVDRLNHELVEARRKVADAEGRWDESEEQRIAARNTSTAETDALTRARDDAAKKLEVLMAENVHLHNEVANLERQQTAAGVAHKAAVAAAVERVDTAHKANDALVRENTALRSELLVTRRDSTNAQRAAEQQLRDWKAWVADRKHYAPVDELLKRCAGPTIPNETAELVADCLTWHHTSEASTVRDNASNAEQDAYQRAASPSHLIRT